MSCDLSSRMDGRERERERKRGGRNKKPDWEGREGERSGDRREQRRGK